MAEKTKTISVREQRKLLRTLREQSGISLDALGERAKLSKAMLSRFETGTRELSAEALTRVLTAMSELLAEDDARRKQEREKAVQTTVALFTGVLGVPVTPSLAELFTPGPEVEKEAARIAKSVDEVDNLIAVEKSKALRQIKNPKFAKQLLEHYWALIEFHQKILDLEARGYVAMPKAVEEERDQLKARVAELEQELARERANKAGDSPG